MTEHPAWFELCHSSPKGMYRIYRMNLRSALERQAFPAPRGCRLEAAHITRPTD
jgi:hypothetical protein